ncbi:hypothetical protein ACFSCX_02960 [Bacillus salitolerans]|uniref:Small acid-soluble spore protein O n=1 Tax=Bacillus salitolerans TaxID=1437434 RepID=A0ABW4LJX3_9BACI
MAKRVQRKKHAGDNNHTMSKDLLQEEFGTELGNYNANKPVELVAEAKAKKKK